MSDDQTSSSDEVEQQIRHNLVNTAVNFLLNPSVIDKPYDHKSAFLRKKGLTEAEISLAFEKAEKDPRYKQLQNSNVPNIPPPLPPPVPVYRRSLSFWSGLSRFSSSLIVLGVALYGAHYVYKKFIEPFLFGKSDDDDSKKLEKQLFDVVNSLSQLEKHVSALEESIDSQKNLMDKFLQNEANEYYPTPVALRELKTEISSVKSLLLNRHQFPALPKVTPPTIPKWQLPSKENGNDTTKQNGEVNKSSDEEEVVCEISNKPSSESGDPANLINRAEEITGNSEVQILHEESTS